MRPPRFILRLTLACVATAVGLGFLATAEAGTLVVAGGRLSPEHEAVYRATLDDRLTTGPLGVVPLASGVPERSGPLTVQDFRQYVDDPGLVFDTEVVHDDPAYAGSAECAAVFASCGALWFTGGDQSRITANLRPAAGDTPGFRAVHELIERGGVVGGTSAGAAMMSRWMLTGGSSADAMLLGARPGVDVPGVGYAQGMDLFPYGVIDQHFLRRGRFGRLLTACGQLEQDFGFGVSENRAMRVDLAAHTARVIGDDGLTLLDLRLAEREGHGWSNVRLSILSDGDVVGLRDGGVDIDPRRGPLATAGSADVPPVSFPEMWDAHVVKLMVRVLAMNPGLPVTSTDGGFDYRMTADAQTRFFAGRASGKNETSLSALSIRLDVTPRDGLEQRIADRLAVVTDAEEPRP
ncbi:MAG: cyanophycinase [Planctomycetota bacterium]